MLRQQVREVQAGYLLITVVSEGDVRGGRWQPIYLRQTERAGQSQASISTVHWVNGSPFCQTLAPRLMHITTMHTPFLVLPVL